MRGARFFGVKLAPQIGDCVFFEGNTRIAALLRAVMNEPILADIKIAAAGAAAPLIRAPEGDVVLKCIYACETAFLERLHLVVDALLFGIQRLHLARAIVDDSYGRAEAQFQRALADGERVLRMAHSAADD